MKKFALILLACAFFIQGYSQNEAPITPSVSTKKFQMPTRGAADHFMIQVSMDNWTGMPDSISSHKKGFSRGLNIYFMLDKQFKNSPKFSIAGGLGIGSSNMFFKKMNIDLKSNSGLLPFTAMDSTNHFKKYKLSTSYLEIPLEFRYTSNPNKPNGGFKAAIGLKIGTLINAHTKGKEVEDKNNNTVASYIQKESSKVFINSTRFMATARVGYGIFSVFGSYQLNNVLKDGTGAEMKLYQIGLTISGL